MKNRFSIIIMLFLCFLSFETIYAQATCIKLKNGTQLSYPTNCIRKLYFSGNQLVLDLINPSPIVVVIDSIQTIHFNQTLIVHSATHSDAVKIDAPKQLLTLLMPKNEKKISIIRSFLTTI